MPIPPNIIVGMLEEAKDPDSGVKRVIDFWAGNKYVYFNVLYFSDCNQGQVFGETTTYCPGYSYIGYDRISHDDFFDFTESVQYPNPYQKNTKYAVRLRVNEGDELFAPSVYLPRTDKQEPNEIECDYLWRKIFWKLSNAYGNWGQHQIACGEPGQLVNEWRTLYEKSYPQQYIVLPGGDMRGIWREIRKIEYRKQNEESELKRQAYIERLEAQHRKVKLEIVRRKTIHINPRQILGAISVIKPNAKQTVRNPH